MIVFRLSKAAYANDLSGKGAEKSGGRWNPKGIAMIYTSSSRALCTAEIAVHLPLGIIPDDFSLITLEISDKIKIKELSKEQLPKDWKNVPPSFSSQQTGHNFVLENEYAVMKVPSVVVPGDYNYLINPNHKDIKKIKIVAVEPFEFDRRLFLK